MRTGGNYNRERGYNPGSGRGLCLPFRPCPASCPNGLPGARPPRPPMSSSRGALNCGYGCAFEFLLSPASIVAFTLGLKPPHCSVCVCVVTVGLFLLWIVAVSLFAFLLSRAFKTSLGVIGRVEERRGLWICLGFVNGGLFGGLGCR